MRQVRAAFTGRGVVRQGVLIRALLGLSACALTALVYIPAADHPFVLDDRTRVVLNPALVDPGDLGAVVRADPWHPLIDLSFAGDVGVSGVSSFGFHLTNASLHVLVVALLFVLVSRRPEDVFRRRPKTAGAGGKAPSDPAAWWAAFLAAGVFGLNPITVRSAAYVSARGDMLFTAGVLLLALLAHRFRAAARGPKIAVAMVAALMLAANPWGVAPHGPPRFYLTAAVLLLAAGWASRPLLARSRGLRVAAAMAVAALILVTRGSLAQWHDPVELWRAEAARAPAASDAHLGYADALREASSCGQAVPEYREALRLNPDLGAARDGLSRCHAR